MEVDLIATHRNDPKIKRRSSIVNSSQISALECYICCITFKHPFSQFAACKHRVLCLSCGEELIKDAMNQGTIPVCPVEKCNKKLADGDDSILGVIS